MKIKVHNEDSFNLNKKWLRTIILIFAVIEIGLASAQLIYLWVKPTGYEQLFVMLGGHWMEKLFSGIFALVLYFVIKRSKAAAK